MKSIRRSNLTHKVDFFYRQVLSQLGLHKPQHMFTRMMRKYVKFWRCPNTPPPKKFLSVTALAQADTSRKRD
ncbi:hypothetical protein [Rubritalea tangerina]|uniref:hypothetical protein n=1 Tax=Rubritalea tangerina TaxID=430798 RepID=UPI00361A23B6